MTDDTTDVLVRQARMEAAKERPTLDRLKLGLRYAASGVPIVRRPR